MLLKDKKTSKIYSGYKFEDLSNEIRVCIATENGQVLTFKREDVVELPVPECVGDGRKLRRKKND